MSINAGFSEEALAVLLHYIRDGGPVDEAHMHAIFEATMRRCFKADLPMDFTAELGAMILTRALMRGLPVATIEFLEAQAQLFIRASFAEDVQDGVQKEIRALYGLPSHANIQ